MLEILEQISEFGVVPVVAINTVEHALPLADALAAGGLGVVEVTLRTDAAVEAIRQVATHRPNILVGAGTVLSTEDVSRVKDAGARFALAPGLNEAVVEAAQSLGLAMMPGVMTPSEIERGLSLGCTALKFFPAEQAGGVAALKAVAGPYARTGVRFIPTGGISITNLADYLALDLVAAIGGSFIATPQDLRHNAWHSITTKAKNAADAVTKLRHAAKKETTG